MRPVSYVILGEEFDSGVKAVIPRLPGVKNQGFSFFFHHLQSYAWLRAPVNLCPIGLKISVHVATMCGYGWREFQVPSSGIVRLGSSDVREKSLPGWKFRVEDFSMSVSSQLAPLICVRFCSKLLCMYSDSGASADMNLKSLTQLLRDCGGEESGSPSNTWLSA